MLQQDTPINEEQLLSQCNFLLNHLVLEFFNFVLMFFLIAINMELIFQYSLQNITFMHKLGI